MTDTDAIVKQLVTSLQEDTNVSAYVQRVSEDDIDPAALRGIELRVATDGNLRNVRALMNSNYRYDVQVHVFVTHRVADRNFNITQTDRRKAIDATIEAIQKNALLSGLVNGITKIYDPTRVPMGETDDVLIDITIDYDVIERRT